MNTDGPEDLEFPDEDKSVKNGVLGEMQSSYGADDEAGDELQRSGIVQVQHQQSQGSVVCWERFLHVRSIRVLLVENDHSTRHVVSALLRNCNYEVLDAANGLQAWRILEDPTNHIDLVLTEVAMPCLSGIALLCKIMSHKNRKNIPVIMMSSNDSMGLVVMCLSKGAVDFLVKPIRKNELKNLWQHVWRRCHSSSGSGSESGTQTQKYAESKDSEESDNNDSEDGENDGSNGLTIGDGSDDGSGAQSSWTKQAIKIHSSQAMSSMDQAVECQDSTCAQVIHSNAETSGIKRGHRCFSGEDNELKQYGTTVKSKDLVSTNSRKRESKSENPFETSLVPVYPNSKSLSESNCNMNKHVEDGLPNQTNEFIAEKLKYGLGRMPNSMINARESESSRELTNKSNTSDKSSDDLKGPNLEISLKRLRGVKDTGRSIQDDRYILRRSEQSAFSRYNTSPNIVKIGDGITGSSLIVDCSGEVAKRDSAGDIQALSTDRAVHQGSNGVSNNIDMGSTTNKLSTHSSTKKDKSEATSTINCVKPSAFKHEKTVLRSSQHQDCLLLPKDMHGSVAPIRGLYKDNKIQHSNFQKNHHFRHVEDQPSSKNDDSIQKLDPLFRSSNCLNGPMDDDHSNNSLNRSASGSNHGSNGQNCCHIVVNTQGTNGESNFGQAGKSGSGDASGSGCGNSLAENRLAHREAALNKFRQKRKERCFKKKVRYQNRKKLAEQRPRVRGQFVKQPGTNGSNTSVEE